MALNLIETLKTSIYSPRHTKNTKLHFENSKFSTKKNENTYFQQKNDFNEIRVFRWFSWLAFGGPKILVYTYIYIYIWMYIYIYIFVYVWYISSSFFVVMKMLPAFGRSAIIVSIYGPRSSTYIIRLIIFYIIYNFT